MKRARYWAYNLLRKSEKLFKTDMVYLAKGGFWLTLGQFAASLSSFALAITFAHFLTKEDYGQYKYILSIASLLSTLTLTGLGSSVMRSVSNNYEGTLAYAFWKNIKWSFVYFLASLAFSIYYFVHGNNTLATGLLIAGCLSPFFASTNLYSSFLTAKRDFKKSALYYDVIGNIFPTICLILGIMFIGSPLGLVAIYFLSNTLIGLILYARVVRQYKPSRNVDPTSLGYAKHLSLINVFANLASNIDQILVFHYIGAAELAVYNFAIAIPNQTKGPMKSLSNLMFPKFVKRDESELHSGMGYKIGTLFITGILISAVYIFLAPYIFQIFFPKYLESIKYSQIFALSLVSLASRPTDTFLAAKMKIKEQYFSNITISIIQIVLIYLSIVFWGLIGLIIARVIIRIISSVLNISIYYHFTRNKMV